MNKTINQICQSFNQNWEISAEGKEQWILSFFIKAKFNNLTKELMLEKLNKFYQTDLSEISFKACFKGYLCSMPTYDSPNNYKKQLKIEELQKIAKKLSDFINIPEDQAYFFTKKMCYQNSQDKWNADLLFKTIESYDPELLSSILYPQVAVNAA